MNFADYPKSLTEIAADKSEDCRKWTPRDLLISLLPDTFRAPCLGPATDGVQTVGDLASFSLRQEAALQSCEAKRAGIVDLVDKAQKPLKPWWKVW